VKKGPLEISIFKRNQVYVEKFTKNKRDKTKKEASQFHFRAGTFVWRCYVTRLMLEVSLHFEGNTSSLPC
jgi:cytochrome b561